MTVDMHALLWAAFSPDTTRTSWRGCLKKNDSLVVGYAALGVEGSRDPPTETTPPGAAMVHAIAIHYISV